MLSLKDRVDLKCLIVMMFSRFRVPSYLSKPLDAFAGMKSTASTGVTEKTVSKD